MAREEAKTIDESGAELIDPRKVLMEQTLAVDLSRVELDQQIATAHKYPRSIDAVVKKIAMLATYNREAAENCVYALPRAGKPIIGASIGFASIVAQSWGNCRVASAITYVDRREKAVIAEGRFFDLETNVGTLVPVTRRIVDSKGRLYSDDMINVTGMAAASIAARNAVLRGVTRGLWHPIWLDALQVVRGDATTFAERKATAISAMAQFGVKPEQLFAFLGIKGEIELTPEHIPTLRGMYAALRDQSVTVEEMFDPRRMSSRGGFEAVDNPLGDDEGQATQAATAKPTAAPAPAAAEPADETEGMGEAPEPEPERVGPAKPLRAPPVTLEATDDAKAPAPKAAPPAAAGPEKGKPAQTEEAPKPVAATAGFKTTDEYLAYWEEFLAACGSVAAVRDQWARDRSLRGNCGVIGDAFELAKAMKEKREAAIGGGK